MFFLSVKKILDKRLRTLLTSIGICISTIILILAAYYLHVSNSVANENLASQMSEQRILINEIFVGGASYYEYEDMLIEDINPIKDNVLENIISSQGVQSIKVDYELNDELLLTVENMKNLAIDSPIGVDTRYDVFSKALTDLIESEDKNFVPIISGRSFVLGEKHAALLSETTAHFLSIKPNEAVGKTIKLSTKNGTSYEIEIIGVYSHLLSKYYRQDVEYVSKYSEADPLSSHGIELIFTSDFLKELNSATNKTEELYPFGVYVTVDDVKYIDDLVAMLQNNYWLDSISDYKMFYEGIEKQAENNKVFFILGVIILIISLLMISNTMMINIAEQTQFIGLLKMVGFNKNRIRMIFVSQSVVYGIIGSFAGAILGYLACLNIGLSTIKSYGQDIDGSYFLLPIGYLAIIIILILFMCVLVGLAVSIFDKKIKTQGMLNQQNDFY